MRCFIYTELSVVKTKNTCFIAKTDAHYMFYDVKNKKSVTIHKTFSKHLGNFTYAFI